MKTMVRKPFYGILLILSIALVGAIGGTPAQGQPGSSFTDPIMYEAVWMNESQAEAQLSSLEANLPTGSAYVGLAAGSHVGSEAQRLGDRLIWEGPFNVPPGGELVLRYWLAPMSPAPQAPTMEITAQTPSRTSVQLGAEPTEPMPLTRAVPENAASPEAVTVQKTADHPEIIPGGEPWVAYRVTFANDSATQAVLDQITDRLAPGFQFVGMAYDSDLEDGPTDPKAPTIIWEGPITVPAQGILQLRYWVKAVETPGTYENSVEATGGGVTIGPATATVTRLSPNLSLAKNASPAIVTLGGTIIYDITVANTGDYQGVVDLITDTLPSGLSFVQMDPSSDISEVRVEEDGNHTLLIWEEPFTILQGDETHLIYQVGTSQVGDFTNSVMARDADGQQLGPVEEEVTVSPHKISLPLVLSRFGKTSTLPMEEDFTTGIPPEWVPFVNYPELSAGDWFYQGDRTTWGRYTFNAGEALNRFALTMFLGERAQEWTDYRIEATLRSGKEYKNPLVGIWFRGTYQERHDNLGGDVTGYFFLMKPDKDPRYSKAYIGHIDPSTRVLAFTKDQERTFTNQTNIWYDVTIEVRGTNIKVWVDGTPIYNWNDPNATWTQGTVGFTVFGGTASFDSVRVTALD
jgi:uncharacterized repeat protein (TIGR01451 family)